MEDIRRLGTSAKLSRAVAYGGLLFLSGQTADDWDGDIEQQCREALTKVDHELAQAGSSKDRLLSVQVWLKHAERDFAAMNEVWIDWLPSGAAPARSTAQCDLAASGILVEFTVIAAEGKVDPVRS